MVAKAKTRKSKAAPPEVARRLFTLDEYHRMTEAGILCEDERTELWEGEIVLMAPIGPDHAGSTGDLNNWLARRLPEDVIVWMQNPVDLPPRSEPQPDILVLKPRPDRYHTSHPGPEDVLLLVEVSDSSLRYDRNTKLPRYAEAGIPEVWIQNLQARQLLVFRDLIDGVYTTQLGLGPEDTVAPAAFPDVNISVARLFG